MSRIDSPFDPGADSCTKRTAQLLAVTVLLPVLAVRVVRKARRR